MLPLDLSLRRSLLDDAQRIQGLERSLRMRQETSFREAACLLSPPYSAPVSLKKVIVDVFNDILTSNDVTSAVNLAISGQSTGSLAPLLTDLLRTVTELLSGDTVFCYNQLTIDHFKAVLSLALCSDIALASAAARLSQALAAELFAPPRYRVTSLLQHRLEVSYEKPLSHVVCAAADQVMRRAAKDPTPMQDLYMSPALSALAAGSSILPSTYAGLGAEKALSLMKTLLQIVNGQHLAHRMNALTALAALVAAHQMAKDGTGDSHGFLAPLKATNWETITDITNQVLTAMLRMFPREDEGNQTKGIGATCFDVASQWAHEENAVSRLQLLCLTASLPSLAAARAFSPLAGLTANPPLVLARLLEIYLPGGGILLEQRPDLAHTLATLAVRTASFPWAQGVFRCIGFCQNDDPQHDTLNARYVPILVPAVIAGLASPFVAVRAAAADSLRRMTRTQHALCSLTDCPLLAHLVCGDKAFWTHYQRRLGQKATDDMVHRVTNEQQNTSQSSLEQGALGLAPMSLRDSDHGPDPNAPMPILFAQTTVECVAATGAFCNLVLFQSPVKPFIVPLVTDRSLPVLSRLVTLATSPNEPVSLVTNAVWALRNLVYQAERSLRSVVADALGVEGLRRCLLHDSDQVATLGAALLRNLVWHMGTEEDMSLGLHPFVQVVAGDAVKRLIQIVNRAKQRDNPTRFLQSEIESLIHLVGVAHNLYSFPSEAARVTEICPATSVSNELAVLILCENEALATAAIRATWNIYRVDNEGIKPALQAIHRAVQSNKTDIKRVAEEIQARIQDSGRRS